MARITHDCELMLQPTLEKTLTDARTFKVVYDTLYRPSVFTINTRGRLLVIAPDDKGRNQLVDLSHKLSLDSGEVVTCFTITQAEDLRVQLVCASASTSKISRLHVLSPFLPTAGDWLDGEQWSSIIQSNSNSTRTIHKLLLGHRDDGSGFPFMAAIFSELGEVRKDLARLSIDFVAKSWKWETDLTFPFHFDDMLDLCLGTIPGGSGKHGISGIFGLDKTQGRPSLTFRGLKRSNSGPTSPFVSTLPVVDGAQSLATTLDPDGFTNIIVAGNGILHISAQDCLESVPQQTVKAPTLKGEGLDGLKDISVAQTGPSITFWARNSDCNLIMQAGKMDDSQFEDGILRLDSLGSTIPLLPVGQRVHLFNALTDPSTLSQYLFVLCEDGSVTSLEQCPTTKLWTTTPMRVPDPEDYEDLPTYMSHVKVFSETGIAYASMPVQIATTSQRVAIVNGQRIMLTTSKTTAMTDENGSLTIIFQSSDFSSPSIAVSGADIKTDYIFNPASKVIAKLAAIAQKGQLGDLQARDGRKIIPGLTTNQDALGKAATILVDLQTKYDAIVEADQSLESSESGSSTGPAHLVMANTLKASNSSSVSILWEFWHGITVGVEALVDISYKAGDFIIKTSKKVWRFIVTTAEHALKAIGEVFAWLGARLEEVVTALAEFLDWESILDTKDFFVEVANTGMDALQDLVKSGADIVDTFFLNIEEDIGSWHLPPVLSKEMQDLKPDVKSAKDKKESDLQSQIQNPVASWGSYHMEHGDVKRGLDEGMSSDDGESGIFATAWEQIIKPIWDNIKEMFQRIWNDAKLLFDSKSNLTWKDILKNIGTDIVLGIVKGCRKAIVGLLKTCAQVINLLKKCVNLPIDVWVISRVYHKMTGTDMTILDLLSLIWAIPTTFIFKLVYGKKPKDFPAIKTMLDQMRSEKKGTTSLSTAETPENQFSDSKTASVQPMFLVTHMSAISMDTSRLTTPTTIIDTSTTGDAPNANNPKTTADKNAMVYNRARNLAKSTAFTRLRWLLRTGMAFKTIGMAVYTATSTVATMLKWPTALDTLDYDDINEMYGDRPKWKKAHDLYTAIVICLFQFPSSKLDRPSIPLRILFWSASSATNIWKSGMPDAGKVPLAGLAGCIDFVGYVLTMAGERLVEGKVADTGMEISNMLLTSTWAIGSTYCAFMHAAEPYSLTATITVGIIMNIQGLLLAKAQYNYWKEHQDDEDYNPPSYQTSLSGSLY